MRAKTDTIESAIANQAHILNAVDLESMRRVTQSIALFIGQWCGLDKYGKDWE